MGRSRFTHVSYPGLECVNPPFALDRQPGLLSAHPKKTTPKGDFPLALQPFRAPS